MQIHLPHLICRDTEAALRREWLATNGIGGFASGTVAGGLTRRYHGLLIAALDPPVGRTLLAAKLDAAIVMGDRRIPLYTNVWPSGVEDPPATKELLRFDLYHNIPTWTYRVDHGTLIRRIWMEHGRNLTYVQYELSDQARPLQLNARLLVNDRNYHLLTDKPERRFQIAADGERLQVRGPHSEVPLNVLLDGNPAATWKLDHTWCDDFELRLEAARGFEHRDSHLSAGTVTVTLAPGTPVTFALTADEEPVDCPGAHTRAVDRAETLLDDWAARTGWPLDEAPTPVTQLVLAADQFVVSRRGPKASAGHTVVAGYPWFTDWGRDTMVALPGLTLVTGRFDLAREILRTWSHYERDGLIPNRFPDEGYELEYHTADATLWYLWAIDQYFRATGDLDTLADLFPMMREIVEAHRRGTRHGIHVGDDGLVHAEDPGYCLTWMDAKVAGHGVTPRMGKPIELSALWYDALCNLARLADLLDEDSAFFVHLANATRGSFHRFWHADRQCCMDVLDGPDGNDLAIRPNQIFAVALNHSPFSRDQQLQIVAKCEWHLLTWFGMRTLDSDDPFYTPHYGGNPAERDAAYHQGTVWGWLLGPYVTAHYRLHKDADYARGVLEPMAGQLWTYGLGSLAEIADATEPFRAGGCIAQAWSVAETLRAWWITQRQPTAQPTRVCQTV